MLKASHPGRWAGLGSSSSSSSSSSLALRERRGVRVGGVVLGGDLSSHLPYHYPPLHGLPPASQRHTAREERHCLGVQAQPSVRTPVSSPGTSLNPAPVARQPESQFSSSSSESLTVGSGGAGGLSVAARRGGEGHLPPSQIPRAVGGAASAGSTSSSSHHGPAGHGSPCPSVSSSDGLSPPPRCPSSATSSSSSTSTLFAGRLGQPPRGPLSLHSYSRKNVFLQHSLHTAELQALAQRDV